MQSLETAKPETSRQKKLLGVYQSGSQHWVGDGFPVRNLFPSNGLDSSVMSPFLMLDYAGPAQFKPTTTPRGVGEHPHRGFETVTIAYQGSVEHRDSGGNRGVIGPGDVQWMTAASGVVHEEKHEREFAKRGGTFEMVQLWVNLPKAHKMSKPRYQGIASAEIPVIELAEGASARVIAGDLLGARGPARTFTPVHVYDLHLKSGSEAVLPLKEGFNSTLVLRNGDVTLNGGTSLKGEAQMALLDPQGDRVSLLAKTDSDILVLSGEPIHEPVVSYGPFVMNTEAEIRQAMDDYRAGRMGHLR